MHKSIEDIAKEVIQGDWGNCAERKQRIESAGYDYNQVQRLANEIIINKIKRNKKKILIKNIIVLIIIMLIIFIVWRCIQCL